MFSYSGNIFGNKNISGTIVYSHNRDTAKQQKLVMSKSKKVIFVGAFGNTETIEIQQQHKNKSNC